MSIHDEPLTLPEARADAAHAGFDARLYVGDVSAVLARLPDDHFDAVLCDPPYGLGFMGAGWDHAVPGPAVWREVLRVAKPGAHLVAFGGTKLWHRLAVGIEDGGWNMRDTLMWLYGSGMPKGQNVGAVIGETHPEEGDRWTGYHTGLRPSWEPALLARKPSPLTFADNAMTHGTGAINVDGARLGDEVRFNGPSSTGERVAMGDGWRDDYKGSEAEGRWPPNVIVDPDVSTMLGPDVSRFYYCAKASRREREAGLSHMPTYTKAELTGREAGSAGLAGSDGSGHNPLAGAYGSGRHNPHPTVKPVDLIRWLATLILPPPRADGRPRRVLVPFSGVCSEVIGCMLAGFEYAAGVELDRTYAEVGRERVLSWRRYGCDDSDAAEAETMGQRSLFDPPDEATE